ncbi:hypothetical protein DENSPDRAFT_849982 [Dentipellis sp. KUC8613]|nr:hypothetical protein DENSPDRAFT_849982 [Dentipellis sp. KUC8613]
MPVDNPRRLSLHTIRHSFSSGHARERIRQQIYPIRLPFPTKSVHAMKIRDVSKEWTADVYITLCPPDEPLSLHDAVLIHVRSGSEEEDMRVKDGGCIFAVNSLGEDAYCLTFGPPNSPRYLVVPNAWVTPPRRNILQYLSQGSRRAPPFPREIPGSLWNNDASLLLPPGGDCEHIRHAPHAFIWVDATGRGSTADT